MLAIGLVLLALSVIGVMTLVADWHPGVEPWRGDLLQTSISFDGRWEAQAYELNPGAMASEKWRVQVRDLDDPDSAARNVWYEYGLGQLSWNGPDTLVVTSYSNNERRELDIESATEVYVGPDPWTIDNVFDFLWIAIVGPLTMAFGLLGVLLTLAGSSPRVKRALFGPRAVRAANGESGQG
jgi:hypothetical protein